MKNWLVRISKPLLTTAMASVILFGEYEYPTEK